jgi:hypothetical protein
MSGDVVRVAMDLEAPWKQLEQKLAAKHSTKQELLE